MLESVSATQVGKAKEVLDRDSVVLVTDLIDQDTASELAELILAAPQRGPGAPGHDFVPVLLNHDLRFVELMCHPVLLELAHHLVGGRTEPAKNGFAWPVDDQIRLANLDGLISNPGCEPGWWHMDSPMGQMHPGRSLPDFPIAVNAIWILTPFRQETGATRIVPGSQSRRHLPPATQQALADEVHCVADPGSALIVPNTIWHAAGTNSSDKPRIGCACVYQPWWIGRLTMDTYPVRAETWRKLPPEAQALTKHQLSWDTDFEGELRDVQS